MSGFLMLINNMLETNVGLLKSGMSGRDKLRLRLVQIKTALGQD
jgi:hypothetical protein